MLCDNVACYRLVTSAATVVSDMSFSARACGLQSYRQLYGCWVYLVATCFAAWLLRSVIFFSAGCCASPALTVPCVVPSFALAVLVKYLGVWRAAAPDVSSELTTRTSPATTALRGIRPSTRPLTCSVSATCQQQTPLLIGVYDYHSTE